MLRRVLPLVGALALLLAGCASGDSVPHATPATSAPATSATTAPPGSGPTTTATVSTAAATPSTPGCPAVPARATPDPARPHYTLTADVHPADGTVDGRLQVRFTPDVDTDRLVFRLWPNGPPASPGVAVAKLDASQVTVAQKPATTNLDDPTTLVVTTTAPFRAGQPVDAALAWHLQVSGPADDRVSRNGDAMRLGSFFPILPWEPGVGWDTDPAVGGFAEASTAPTADFDLTVTVPSGFGVLASGTPDPAKPGHFTATAMRDVAASVGRFTTASRVANAPQAVQVTVGVEQGLPTTPDVYLDRAVRSLEDFGRRFGPYPWPTFTLAVTPDLGGGIEYPSHVMEGPDAGGVTSHEVAHQWFYGLVGNDQGRDPWLDEGLASWGEARFNGTLEKFNSRIVPAAVRHMVGQPMSFWATRPQNYQDGVYTEGVQALTALGSPDLVDCALRIYVAQNAYRIARQSDLIRAASAVFPNAAATLTSYGAKP